MYLVENEIKSEGKSPGLSIILGAAYCFDLDEVKASFLESLMARDNAVSLTTAVLGNSACPITLEAVAVNRAGGIQIRYQLSVSGPSSHTDVYDIALYGGKILCFACPDGTMLGSYNVEVLPEESLRPCRAYNIWNHLTNCAINQRVEIEIAGQILSGECTGA